MLKPILVSVLSITTLLTLVSCNSSDSMPEANASIAIEAGVTVVSSIADDLATGGIGVSSLVNTNEFTCVGAWNGCSNGVKTRSTECSNPGVSWSKDISLDFYKLDTSKDTACNGLATAGNYVIRTGTETLPINIIGTFAATSETANNYKGEAIGGGTKITKNPDNTASIDILGITKTHTDRDGVLLWDQSIYTDVPLVVNQFARNGRVISSGTLVVDNNTNEFTATMVFSNVTYTTGCCYPTSGTLTTTFTGTKTGTTTVTFSATCDNALFAGAFPGILTMITCSSSVN